MSQETDLTFPMKYYYSNRNQQGSWPLRGPEGYSRERTPLRPKSPYQLLGKEGTHVLHITMTSRLCCCTVAFRDPARVTTSSQSRINRGMAAVTNSHTPMLANRCDRTELLRYPLESPLPSRRIQNHLQPEIDVIGSLPLLQIVDSHESNPWSSNYIPLRGAEAHHPKAILSTACLSAAVSRLRS
jgi:hypothetical protein